MSNPMPTPGERLSSLKTRVAEHIEWRESMLFDLSDLRAVDFLLSKVESTPGGARPMTEAEVRGWGVGEGVCRTVLSERLPDDSACLLPLPCPNHPLPVEGLSPRDVLAEVLVRARIPDHDWDPLDEGQRAVLRSSKYLDADAILAAGWVAG